MRFVSGFLAGLALLIVIGLALIWTGAYNVAASAGHTSLGRWVLDSIMERSVEVRADGAAGSNQLFQTADLEAGFRGFQESCVHCHGAPGVQPHEWTRGMTPEPPELSGVAADWSPGEIFWIAKHGIKMTGMPAFGGGRSDETIRNIAAFVDRMEGMTPARYAEIQQRWGSSGGHEHNGEGHSHAPGSGH